MTDSYTDASPTPPAEQWSPGYCGRTREDALGRYSRLHGCGGGGGEEEDAPPPPTSDDGRLRPCMSPASCPGGEHCWEGIGCGSVGAAGSGAAAEMAVEEEEEDNLFERAEEDEANDPRVGLGGGDGSASPPPRVDVEFEYSGYGSYPVLFSCAEAAAAPDGASWEEVEVEFDYDVYVLRPGADGTDLGNALAKLSSDYLTELAAEHGMVAGGDCAAFVALGPGGDGRVRRQARRGMRWLQDGEITVVELHSGPDDVVDTTPGVTCVSTVPNAGSGSNWSCVPVKGSVAVKTAPGTDEQSVVNSVRRSVQDYLEHLPPEGNIAAAAFVGTRAPGSGGGTGSEHLGPPTSPAAANAAIQSDHRQDTTRRHALVATSAALAVVIVAVAAVVALKRRRRRHNLSLVDEGSYASKVAMESVDDGDGNGEGVEMSITPPSSTCELDVSASVLDVIEEEDDGESGEFPHFYPARWAETGMAGSVVIQKDVLKEAEDIMPRRLETEAVLDYYVYDDALVGDR